MKALLIDPHKQIIESVELSDKKEGHSEEIYKLLNCRMFECPINYENGDTMYCNEEAWLEVTVESELAGFHFPNWSYPILGKALILGEDEEGDDQDCRSTVEDFKDIKWCDNTAMRLHGEELGAI